MKRSVIIWINAHCERLQKKTSQQKTNRTATQLCIFVLFFIRFQKNKNKLIQFFFPLFLSHWLLSVVIFLIHNTMSTCQVFNVTLSPSLIRSFALLPCYYTYILCINNIFSNRRRIKKKKKLIFIAAKKKQNEKRGRFVCAEYKL